MANQAGPVCRLCRREGTKLFLKGSKCLTNCTFDKRNALLPGQHGLARRRKTSDYGIQLRAKQRARRQYGVLEAQFRTYFARAERSTGVTGTILLQQLERRIDNVVYRLGLAASRKQARQLVGHGHFDVNGRLVDRPSFQVRVSDQIKVRQRNAAIDVAIEASKPRSVPSWLTFKVAPDGKDGSTELEATVIGLPERDEMEIGVEEHLIVEFYSR
jgi:small subunit ribosomal protein S4